MLATGGSAIAAIRYLIDHGATQEDITFLNVVSCPEGIARLYVSYPRIQVVTGTIDDGLNDKVCELTIIIAPMIVT
jgi:uracil phosphoribosyltransferase